MALIRRLSTQTGGRTSIVGNTILYCGTKFTLRMNELEVGHSSVGVLITTRLPVCTVQHHHQF